MAMLRYRLVDLDPQADLDDLLERYARDGWHTWDAGRGALIEQGGRTVRRVSLRKDPDVSLSAEPAADDPRQANNQPAPHEHHPTTNT